VLVVVAVVVVCGGVDRGVGSEVAVGYYCLAFG
jgi:hypothetical protein